MDVYLITYYNKGKTYQGYAFVVANNSTTANNIVTSQGSFATEGYLIVGTQKLLPCEDETLFNRIIFEGRTPDGASAYQTALKYGFKGTEKEWLDSLKGKDGRQGVQGPQGVQGIKGDTGPQGPVGPQGIEGKVGKTGAQGPKGDKGEKGDKGDQGIQGIPGLQGPKGDKMTYQDLTSTDLKNFREDMSKDIQEVVQVDLDKFNLQAAQTIIKAEDTVNRSETRVNNIVKALEGVDQAAKEATDAANIAVEKTNAALSNLNTIIKDTIKSDSPTYSIRALTEEELLLKGVNWREGYCLTATLDGVTTDVKEAEVIPIYKDSSLQSVDLVDEKPSEEGTTKGQFLKFVYVLADGTESTTYIDVSKFLVETEFKEGFQINTNGEVSIKIDADSEFLSVSENGLKVSGINSVVYPTFIHDGNKLYIDNCPTSLAKRFSRLGNKILFEIISYDD